MIRLAVRRPFEIGAVDLVELAANSTPPGSVPSGVISSAAKSAAVIASSPGAVTAKQRCGWAGMTGM